MEERRVSGQAFSVLSSVASSRWRVRVRGPEVDFVGVLSESVGHPTTQASVADQRRTRLNRPDRSNNIIVFRYTA
jgi:hypothetical protein